MRIAYEKFTAAGISVVYALELARRNVGFPLGPLETAYVARARARAAYRRTMEVCHATREWDAKAEQLRRVLIDPPVPS